MCLLEKYWENVQNLIKKDLILSPSVVYISPMVETMFSKVNKKDLTLLSLKHKQRVHSFYLKNSFFLTCMS